MRKTDENGVNWFGKLECKRCLHIYTADKHGEVPAHLCLGSWFASASSDDVYHYPIPVDGPSGKRGKRSGKRGKRSGKRGMMIELATRAVACKHWRWMPGMWVRYKTGVAARGRFLYRDETYMHLLAYDDEAGRPTKRMRLIKDWSEALPDFDDPATLGCLLALVRQAYGCMMYVRWWDNPQPDMGGQSRARCEVVDTLGRNRLAGARTYYHSEAEALVAALEAAP